jgi:dTDP-glucose 4,6-dehydratase
MIRILVTGGCGFLGSAFIRHLLDTSSRINVICFDRDSADDDFGRLAEVAGDPRLRCIQGDITDRGAVRPAFVPGLTAIVNCAEVGDEGSSASETVCMKVNVAGTQTLLDAARDFRVPRFVQVSSGSVYRDSSDGPVHEESEPRPTGPYAASKAAADHLVRGYAQACGIGAVVARASATDGPYQAAERPLPRFITSVLRGEPSPGPGDGARFGDWLHVSDLCAALDRLWRYGRTGEIYHVSAGCPRSGWDLTQAVLAAAGRPRLPLRAIGPDVDLGSHAVLDGSKIERDLEWRSLIPLDRGLKHTVHWYRTHPNWGRSALLRRAS